MRGVPQCIRSDNGPEFIALAIRRWLCQVDVETQYIEPGSPWENGYAESFHSRLRDEFLALELFESLSAATRLTRQWRDDYNHHRPHSSLGYVTPIEFVACCDSFRSGYALTPAAQRRLPNPTFIAPGTENQSWSPRPRGLRVLIWFTGIMRIWRSTSEVMQPPRSCAGSPSRRRNPSCRIGYVSRSTPFVSQRRNLGTATSMIGKR